MNILRSPTFKTAQKTIEDSLREEKTILIVGSCTVNYQGRAGSVLPEGERITIIKPDGTVLVHQKEKREPVNWNPPGCKATVKNTKEGLQIISTRSEPKEILKIVFNDLQIVSSFELEDKEELQLIGSEDDLVKSIIQEPSLIEEGFTPKEKNMKIKSGEVDLYGIDSEGKGVVIEFKRDKATSSAVYQLGRYLEELEKKLEKEIRGIIAAPKITTGANRLLDKAGLEYVKIEELPTRSFDDVVYDSSQKQIKEFDNRD